MKTPVTELFGIKLPIICGGMVWISSAKLAAAVSNAGGLGLLAGGSSTALSLSKEIEKTRRMTDMPFGVNIPIMYPISSDLVKVVIEKDVKAVFTSAGSPKKYTAVLKEAGVKVAHVVPSATLAKKCEAAGVDTVVAEGSEGGGHIARDEINTMILTPATCDAVNIPVIAAGGIGNGREMAAAFALGAQGVQIGTRFLASVECEGHENFKNAIVKAGESGTVVTGKAFEPVRGIRNKLTDEILRMEYEGKDSNEIMNFIGLGRARDAGVSGDVEWGTVQAGQVAGMIDEILPVQEIIDKMIAEAKEAIFKISGLFV